MPSWIAAPRGTSDTAAERARSIGSGDRGGGPLRPAAGRFAVASQPPETSSGYHAAVRLVGEVAAQGLWIAAIWFSSAGAAGRGGTVPLAGTLPRG